MPELPEVETVRQVIEQQIQGLTIEKITVRRPEERHTHIIFRLDNGKELRFSDTRRFGRFCLIRNGETDTYSGIEKLGKEPFDPDFTAEYLSARLGKRKKAIKECLMEQSVIAGIIPQQLAFFIRKNEISPEEYLETKGRDYRNTPFLQVYGHAGEPCSVCGKPLCRPVHAASL